MFEAIKVKLWNKSGFENWVILQSAGLLQYLIYDIYIYFRRMMAFGFGYPQFLLDPKQVSMPHPKCPKCLRCLDYPWQHHPVSRERPSSCLGSWWKEATSPTPAATWISALGPLGRSSGYNMRPPGTRGSSCTCLLISILKSSLS